MVEDLNHNEGVYALAIQQADYRAACWIALRALRRIGAPDTTWLLRLHGAFARRNEGGR